MPNIENEFDTPFHVYHKFNKGFIKFAANRGLLFLAKR